MPLYAFITDDGQRVELFMSLAEYEAAVGTDGSIKLPDGRMAVHTFDGARIGGHIAGCWPMVSEAAGVAPEQVPEVRAIDERHGVPTEYTRDGDPVFESRRHRRKYLKAHGLHDRNGGYGD